MRLSGHIDNVDSEKIEGWFVDRDDVTDKVKLEIYAGEEFLGYGVANGYRQDLESAGIGDGHCAFVFKMPFSLSEEQIEAVKVRLCDSDFVFSPLSDKA